MRNRKITLKRSPERIKLEPHQQVLANLGKLGETEVDLKLKTVLELLNQAGFRTSYSCQGHTDVKTSQCFPQSNKCCQTYIMFRSIRDVKRLFQRCHDFHYQHHPFLSLWNFFRGLVGWPTVNFSISCSRREDAIEIVPVLRFDAESLPLFEYLLQNELLQ